MRNECFERRIINLNKNWHFYKGCADITPRKKGEPLDIPHTWNAIDGQDGGADYFRGPCLYTRELEVDTEDGLLYYIEFGGANSCCKVFLGDTQIGFHEGGYSTFRFDITKPLLAGERTLSVIVDNSPSDSVYPQMADFTFYGGLYRSVHLIVVPKEHLELEYFGGNGLKITPQISGKSAKILCEIYTTPIKSNQSVRATLFDKEGNKISSADCEICSKSGAKDPPMCSASAGNERSGSASADTECSGSACRGKTNSCDTDRGAVCEGRTYHKCTFEIDDVRLWNGVLDPYLYSVRAELWQEERLTDAVTERFGCRTFEIDPDRGFILNGKEYPLRGVSRHQDRVGIGNALLPEHHREDMELIMELGANTVRLAHYQHDRYFLELCDERGLVVWAEIPYISKHLDGGTENTLSQMRELIVQNYNHPSIAMWGLSNEISIGGSGEGLLDNHKRLNELCYALDPTRKTVVAAVSMCHPDDPYLDIPDAVAYNHYFGWYGGETSMMGPWFEKFHKEHPKTPIGVSEYGAEALNWHTSTPTQGDYTEEYQAYYHEQMIKQLFPKKYIFATYVWNMFDFGADARGEGGEHGRNHKGLVTFDRAYKKDAFYAYRAWLSDKPFVHIAGKRYTDRPEEETLIKVYSNLPEVELFQNGKSLGKAQADDHFFTFKVKNSGESRIVARAGGYADEITIRKTDKMREDYILREAGAILNWFDIEAPEGRFSLNDKISDIMRTKEGSALFGSFMAELTKKASSEKKPDGAFEFDMSSEGFAEMLGGFTPLRLSSMMGVMGLSLTKEELLKLNSELNKIKK